MSSKKLKIFIFTSWLFLSLILNQACPDHFCPFFDFLLDFVETFFLDYIVFCA